MLICSHHSIGQNGNIFIGFKVISDNLNEITIQKTGLRYPLKSDPDFTINLKQGNGHLNKPLVTRGLYRIADAIDGHIVYLEEGDNADILMRIRADLNENMKKNVYMKYFHTLAAKGKHAWHYTFFDYLDKRTAGMVFGKNNEREVNDDAALQLFKKSCDKVLQIGEKLVDSLFQKNLVTVGFKNVVKEELKAMYVSNMCSYLTKFKKKNINPDFFEKLNQLTFNDSVYAVQCNTYIQAGSLYTYYIHNAFNPYNFYSNLSNEMNSILANYSGIIKDKLLTAQVTDYIGKDYPPFDSCYRVFMSVCKNETFKAGVKKKVNEYNQKMANQPKIDYAQLIAKTNLLDPNLKPLYFSQVLSDTTATLIDCWATWCIPCKKQMPFIDSIKKQYNNKVKVVYLSFDVDKKKWHSQVKKLKNNQNHFVLKNDFGSAFSTYFNIQLIPRYILLSAKGDKVLNSNMPLPSMKSDFIEEMDKALQ